MSTVKIGQKCVGSGERVYLIAEVGINHNGRLDLALELVRLAAAAGFDAVKFQKRTVDVVYSADELARPRESVFGTTNGDLKYGLELDVEEYREIFALCASLEIDCFASCWDERSVDFIEEFNPPCYKIASASLTDDELLRYHRSTNRPIILSTGMSTMRQIDHAVDVLGRENLIVLHATSTYPSVPAELNLRVIPELISRFDIPVGYSGHEVGLSTTIAAVAVGASVVERHVTLDRSMWGSDQSASVEPQGFTKLCRDIRVVEAALGDGIKTVYESELPIIEKLRRI